MNRSESKYFNTALRMDEAFISLPEEKSMEFITVKEICEEWINNGCQEPISEIEDILNRLRQACVDAFKDREH